MPKTSVPNRPVPNGPVARGQIWQGDYVFYGYSDVRRCGQGCGQDSRGFNGADCWMPNALEGGFMLLG